MTRRVTAFAAAFVAAVLAGEAGAAGGAKAVILGPVEFTMVLPQGRPGTAEPLLETGRAGEGDTVFIWFENGRFVRFGWDSSAAGAVFSSPVPVEGAARHTLMISMGSLQPAAAAPAPADSAESILRELLLIEFDGRTVLRRAGVFAPVRSADEIVFGANRVGAAVVRPFFTGTLGPPVSVPPERALAEALTLGRWTAAPGTAPGWPGAVRLSVRFPRVPADAGDPLVVTGRTGAGDFLYSQTLDSGHIRFGFDHWAVGGAVSAPVALDLAIVHDVVLTFGSLYRPDAPPSERWRRKVVVWLDRHRVFEKEFGSHPTEPGQIVLGYNRIGGSTTGFVFRGQILGAEAVGERELDALAR